MGSADLTLALAAVTPCELPLEGIKDRLEPVHLVAVWRERHQDWSGDAGSAPFFDPFADTGCRTVKSAILEPAIGQIFRQFIGAAGGDRRFRRIHLIEVAGFLPIVSVVPHCPIMRHRLAQHRLCLVDVIGDAGANAVANKEIRIAALRRWRRHLVFVVVLSWVLHVVKLLLIIAIIASLAVVAAKYLLQLI